MTSRINYQNYSSLKRSLELYNKEIFPYENFKHFIYYSGLDSSAMLLELCKRIPDDLLSKRVCSIMKNHCISVKSIIKILDYIFIERNIKVNNCHHIIFNLISNEGIFKRKGMLLLERLVEYYEIDITESNFKTLRVLQPYAERFVDNKGYFLVFDEYCYITLNYLKDFCIKKYGDIFKCTTCLLRPVCNKLCHKKLLVQ